MLGAPVDVKAVLSAALEVAMGMAYLHGRDLIHGNLNGGTDLLLCSGVLLQEQHCLTGCMEEEHLMASRLASSVAEPLHCHAPGLSWPQPIMCSQVQFMQLPVRCSCVKPAARGLTVGCLGAQTACGCRAGARRRASTARWAALRCRAPPSWRAWRPPPTRPSPTSRPSSSRTRSSPRCAPPTLFLGCPLGCAIQGNLLAKLASFPQVASPTLLLPVWAP